MWQWEKIVELIITQINKDTQIILFPEYFGNIFGHI